MAFAVPAALSTALAIAGTAAAVGSAVVGTVSTINANNYQKEVARKNAALMEQNARNRIAQAQEEQLKQDQQTRALLGEQIAAQSASGLSLYGKSQMLTRKSARQLGRQDALNIRDAGEVDAWNFRQIAQDNYDKIRGLNSANNFALLSGFLDAASAGINGLSTMKPSQLNSIFGPSKLAGKTPFAQGANIRFAS